VDSITMPRNDDVPTSVTFAVFRGEIDPLKKIWYHLGRKWESYNYCEHVILC